MYTPKDYTYAAKILLQNTIKRILLELNCACKEKK